MHEYVFGGSLPLHEVQALLPRVLDDPDAQGLRVPVRKLAARYPFAVFDACRVAALLHHFSAGELARQLHLPGEVSTEIAEGLLVHWEGTWKDLQEAAEHLAGGPDN